MAKIGYYQLFMAEASRAWPRESFETCKTAPKKIKKGRDPVPHRCNAALSYKFSLLTLVEELKSYDVHWRAVMDYSRCIGRDQDKVGAHCALTQTYGKGQS